MKPLLLSFTAALLLLSPAASQGKVCFSCKNAKPHKYVCAERDTFTARRNARKLGCKITSYSSSCKCGATVSSKFAGGVALKPQLIWQHTLNLYGLL